MTFCWMIVLSLNNLICCSKSKGSSWYMILFECQWEVTNILRDMFWLIFFLCFFFNKVTISFNLFRWNLYYIHCKLRVLLLTIVP